MRRQMVRWERNILVILALISVVGGGGALAQTTYGGVTFPQGDVAFADRVVAYIAASCVSDANDNPSEVLGPPDACTEICTGPDGCDENAVALGFRLSPLDQRGYLVIEFVDNVLIDVPGEDLFVYVTNARPAQVEISVDGVQFIPVGVADAYPSGFDISSYASQEEEYRFVRLSDVPSDEDHSQCPGASIDAVGAMGPARTIVGEVGGQLELQPVGDLFLDVAGSDDILLILFDTTGSMDRNIDGVRKIDIAKDAIIDFLDALPQGMTIGFRAFAYCDRNELISPLDAPLSLPLLEEEIRALSPGGTTPLAYTLEQAQVDCGCIVGPKTVVIITDGIETCDGDPIAAAQDLAATAPDLTFYVIGFDAGGTLAARDELMEIARVLGGQYLDAEDADELTLALRVITPLAYAVYDEEDNEVASGRLGDGGPGRLPAGTYRIVIEDAPPVVLEGIVISGDEETRISLQVGDAGLTAEIEN